MVLENLTHYVINPLYLLGFLLVVPVIILYMLRPKPKDLKIPSLMLIQEITEKKKLRSIFHRIIRDPLLLIQIIIIGLLTVSAAEPFFTSEEIKQMDGNYAIIIDSSASMNAPGIDPGRTRFERSAEIAREILSNIGEGTVTIISAGNMPSVLIKNAEPESAGDVVEKMSAGDTCANLGDAVLLGRDILSGESGERIIFVISDFCKTEGLDIEMAARVAKAHDIDVEFKSAYLEQESKKDIATNAGIIDMRTQRSEGGFFTAFTVKNYGSDAVNIKADIKIDYNNYAQQDAAISPGSTHTFHASDTFTGSANEVDHIIEVKITGSSFDRFEVDDRIYIVIPGQKKPKVLLIRGEQKSPYLRYALESLDSSNRISLREANPPIIPRLEDFDIIIIGDADPDKILPGTFEDMKKWVSTGGDLIVVGSDNLDGYANKHLDEIMPVYILGPKEGDINVWIRQKEMLGDVSLDEVVFEKYYETRDRDGTVSLADYSAGGDDMPLIAYRLYGAGSVVYMGANHDAAWSNIRTTPQFPLVYLRLIEMFKGSNMVRNYNTGDMLKFDSDVEVKNPSGRTFSGREILLDRSGLYEIRGDAEEIDGGRAAVSAGLLNERESDIFTVNLPGDQVLNESAGSSLATITKIEHLYPFVAAAAVIFLVIELMYMRRRAIL